MREKVKKTAERTRFYRKLHRTVAVPIFLVMFIIGTTGLLLGWKKNVNLLPPTTVGANLDSKTWISIDSIRNIAVSYANTTLQKSDDISRIDVRPEKGIAKVVFATHFSELQIDCATGEILSVRQRNSDLIERIHDGSILDFMVGTNNQPFKLIWTTTAASGLILLSVSGFWLWYNPRRIRRMKSDETYQGSNGE